jgi:hypothetical protein
METTNKLETVRDIIKNITNIDIFEQTRRREVIEMRSVANTYLSKINKMRLMEIVRAYARNDYQTTHASIIHSLKTYDQHKRYNPDLELTYKALIDDNRLYVLERIPTATKEQIEQIEQILL